MPIDITAINATVGSLESLFDRVKERLLNNPTAASLKLGEVLEELGRILEFVERETVRYLELYFLPDKSNFTTCRSALLSLESGYVTVKGYEARGHCHKIVNIYEKYLNQWFSSVLDATEAQEFHDLFTALNTADLDMVGSIHSVTDYLKRESQLVLDLVDADRLDEANNLILQARRDLQQTRRDTVGALATLKLLQASFIASAQTV